MSLLDQWIYTFCQIEKLGVIVSSNIFLYHDLSPYVPLIIHILTQLILSYMPLRLYLFFQTFLFLCSSVCISIIMYSGSMTFSSSLSNLLNSLIANKVFPFLTSEHLNISQFCVNSRIFHLINPQKLFFPSHFCLFDLMWPQSFIPFMLSIVFSQRLLFLCLATFSIVFPPNYSHLEYPEL